MRRSVPGRALAVLALLAILLAPAIASAQHRQALPRKVPAERTALPRKVPAERTATVGALASLWSAWTHLWSQEGSGLDPNGKTLTGTPGGPGASPAGDAGSGLDPNGR